MVGNIYQYLYFYLVYFCNIGANDKLFFVFVSHKSVNDYEILMIINLILLYNYIDQSIGMFVLYSNVIKFIIL